jgi:hypothetical protein
VSKLTPESEALLRLWSLDGGTERRLRDSLAAIEAAAMRDSHRPDCRWTDCDCIGFNMPDTPRDTPDA